jgi:hypothetical protein
VNGVVLMSTILNYYALAPESELIYIGNLPTYAAIADHYEKVQHGSDSRARWHGRGSRATERRDL